MYDKWLAKQPTSNFVSDQLRILSPRDGDLFLIYPGAETQQKLAFKVTINSHQPVESWLNCQRLSSPSNTKSNNEMFLHLRHGNWRLAARISKLYNPINFQVMLGDTNPQRPGFSVIKPTVSHVYYH